MHAGNPAQSPQTPLSAKAVHADRAILLPGDPAGILARLASAGKSDAFARHPQSG